MYPKEAATSKNYLIKCLQGGRRRPLQEPPERPLAAGLGSIGLTDPVRIEAVHWRDNGCFRGCVQCRRKVDTKCSLHPDSGSKVYYRLRVLIRQGDVLLWLTAFDEIAAIIVGTPASEYGSLDVLGRRKLVDSVVGLHFLVNVVKTVKSGFTNVAFAKINPARTKFPDAVLDSIKPTVC